MADLVVIGALAWDRPVRLSGPLGAGARLLGRTIDGRLGGRLGGGGANAATALAKAGRSVALASVIATDLAADAALTAIREIGIDASPVVRREGEGKTTLILIDPAGERVVLGLDWEPAALPDLAPPRPGAAFAGLFLRTPYPGAAAWREACRGPVVAHWPAPRLAGPVDVLVASAEDLDPAILAAPFSAGRAAIGERLSWVVVTRGAQGASAYGPESEIHAPAQAAPIVDATGAGDVFAAGLLEALSAGASMAEALAQACAWGAATVALDSSAPTDAAPGTFRCFGA